LVTIIKDNGKTIKNKEMEYFILQMVKFIRDSFKVIKNKDMVLTSMDVVVNIEVYGKMTK